MFVDQYHHRCQAYEQEFASLEAALDAACEDLELMKACPQAILKDANVVMNLNQIARESERRHWSKVSPLFAAQYEKK